MQTYTNLYIYCDFVFGQQIERILRIKGYLSSVAYELQLKCNTVEPRYIKLAYI